MFNKYTKFIVYQILPWLAAIYFIVKIFAMIMGIKAFEAS